MKAIIDAVNHLKGDLYNTLLNVYGEDKYLFGIFCDDVIGAYTCGTKSRAFGGEILVCTIDQFNECAAEMSEASWIPERNIETKE